MDAAVVKFDALPDAVRAAAQDHDFWLIRGNRVFVRCIVGGIVVGAVLGSADMYAFPGFLNPQGDTVIADLLFRDLKNLAYIFIRKTVLFCRN